jgi:hypothetical protein
MQDRRKNGCRFRAGGNGRTERDRRMARRGGKRKYGPVLRLRAAEYDACPPAFSSFLGNIGGTGATAMATSATSTDMGMSNVTTSAAATSGMITFMDISERTSKAGLRNRKGAS